MSGQWLSWRRVVGHEYILRTGKKKSTRQTHNGRAKADDFNKDAFGHQNYLDKRPQVVLQALLMTFRDYMYDHTESTAQDSHIHTVLKTVLNNTGVVLNTKNLHRLSTDRRQLTAISWVSLVAVVSTSNSCMSTVGRKLMITWVSVAWRH